MKKIIFIFILIFSFNILSSQLAIIPINDQVYEFLEILEIKGVLGKCFLDMKPLSRKEVATLLLKAIDNPNYKKLPPNYKTKLLSYLKKYDYEKRFVEEDFEFIKILEKGLSLMTKKQVSLF